MNGEPAKGKDWLRGALPEAQQIKPFKHLRLFRPKMGRKVLWRVVDSCRSCESFYFPVDLLGKPVLTRWSDLFRRAVSGDREVSALGMFQARMLQEDLQKAGPSNAEVCSVLLNTRPLDSSTSRGWPIKQSEFTGMPWSSAWRPCCSMSCSASS